MEFTNLTAISPVDGRYRNAAKPLSNYFSEWALIRYRVLVEVEYFIELCQLPLPQLSAVDAKIFSKLREVYTNFSIADAQQIKDIEKITNHDVKAVEYFLKEKFDALNLQEYKEFIHFGLTSQDINNTAIPLSIKDAVEKTYLPLLKEIVNELTAKANTWSDVSMLARTHGQAASPTKLGKEILVFCERLQVQINQLKTVPFSAKFGGATGNFNAHHVAYPLLDWKKFGNHFVNNTLKLNRSQYTTQIEHYDNLAALCHAITRINTILIDFSRDVWTYVSMDYFKQKINANEVGSSAMPHKVNPIDFENAEGNLGIANAMFEHFALKLPISRLQRDLTDSTVLRNIGVPFAHSLIALTSLKKGLEKLLLNEDTIKNDLEKNWAVVAEAIQTILRREGYEKPYETLKGLTRTNSVINQESIHLFIDRLNTTETVKTELKKITPHNYTGVF